MKKTYALPFVHLAALIAVIGSFSSASVRAESPASPLPSPKTVASQWIDSTRACSLNYLYEAQRISEKGRVMNGYDDVAGKEINALDAASTYAGAFAVLSYWAMHGALVDPSVYGVVGSVGAISAGIITFREIQNIFRNKKLLSRLTVHRLLEESLQGQGSLLNAVYLDLREQAGFNPEIKPSDLALLLQQAVFNGQVDCGGSYNRYGAIVKILRHKASLTRGVTSEELVELRNQGQFASPQHFEKQDCNLVYAEAMLSAVYHKNFLNWDVRQELPENGNPRPHGRTRISLNMTRTRTLETVGFAVGAGLHAPPLLAAIPLLFGFGETKRLIQESRYYRKLRDGMELLAGASQNQSVRLPLFWAADENWSNMISQGSYKIMHPYSHEKLRKQGWTIYDRKLDERSGKFESKFRYSKWGNRTYRKIIDAYQDGNTAFQEFFEDLRKDPHFDRNIAKETIARDLLEKFNSGAMCVNGRDVWDVRDIRDWAKAKYSY